MCLQDQCGYLAIQCGVVNFVPSYLPPMNELSRVQLILEYFDKRFCKCIIGLHYVEDN